MKKFVSLLMAMLMVLSVCSFAVAENADLAGKTIDELLALAKEEGSHLETVGMPNGWAAWEESWARFTEKYGFTHYDTDMTSAEELAIFKTEGDQGTKDLGDVGIAFTKRAVDEDLLQGYKVSTWDSIPDWAKDPEGRWYISYTGTSTFLVNTTLTEGVVPTSWKELMDTDLRVSVGNVPAGAASQVAVLCAAYAMGGDMDNVQPGIDYFAKLAEQGRLDPGDTTQARVNNGEIECMVSGWDYTTLPWRDYLNNGDSGYKMVALIPSDGAITSGYGLVFNKFSPHPATTALALEYLLSDEGQIDRARGYARPIRDVELPEELASMSLPSEQYANAIPVDDVVKFDAACAKIIELWEEEVVPLMY